MSDPAPDALAHLKTIRALMERATVYRAISAPAALAAGLLTLAVCRVLGWRSGPEHLSPAGFVVLWTGVLAAVTGFNFYLLYRSARRRGDAFASSGMKMALRSVAPPLAGGFFMSLLVVRYSEGGYADIAAFWAMFYGLALLAMGSFAPRSLLVLGLAFLLCGAAALLPEVRGLQAGAWEAALACMALTFGGLHLIYAGCVFAMRRIRPEPGAGKA